MTSINTNIAAQTALRTLQSTNAQLDATQGRISTGLKIGEAKDNAAYWSISTTLKSDNKSLATVKDALGLGAATVDTAYQGLNAAKDVLDEIKAKLTAATQENVDKSAVQSEIAELQKQLQSIGGSATFAGENWLSVNSGTAGYDTNKSVVSSFTRSASGAISIGTIDIDVRSIALFDASGVSEGILDAGKTGNTSSGNLAPAYTNGTEGAAATRATLTYALSDAALTGFTAGDVITFTFDNNGSSVTAEVNVAGTSITRDEIASQLNAELSGTATVGLSEDGNSLVITRSTAGVGSFNLDSIETEDSAGDPALRAIDDASGLDGVDGAAEVTFDPAEISFGAFNGPVTLDDNDTITFQIAVNGGASKFVTIDKATVDEAVSGANGTISTGDDYALVISKALEKAGVEGLTVDYSGSALTFASTAGEGATSISIGSVAADRGSSVIDIDIIGKSAAQITRYIDSVNAAINQITAGAANLGAVAARIELQQTFVNTLMDTIDKGVSGLVDADMNEESTRLQALQVKQQLGVQALSIANQSAQNVLRLFQ